MISCESKTSSWYRKRVPRLLCMGPVNRDLQKYEASYDYVDSTDPKPRKALLLNPGCTEPANNKRALRQRWALQESEIDHIAAQQLQILEEASQLVHVGGRLVFRLPLEDVYNGSGNVHL